MTIDGLHDHAHEADLLMTFGDFVRMKFGNSVKRLTGRCSYCGGSLLAAKTYQCPNCGSDWHVRPQVAPSDETEAVREVDKTACEVRLRYHASRASRAKHDKDTMGVSDFLPEEDVTPAKLCGLFKRAYMKATHDGDQLTIDTDGPKVLMEVAEDHKLLKFVALYTLRDDADAESKLEFMNRLNSSVILVRFSNPSDHPSVLLADYHLPFEEGISFYQVMTALRLFARVVPGAIQACDGGGLVM